MSPRSCLDLVVAHIDALVCHARGKHVEACRAQCSALENLVVMLIEAESNWLAHAFRGMVIESRELCLEVSLLRAAAGVSTSLASFDSAGSPPSHVLGPLCRLGGIPLRVAAPEGRQDQHRVPRRSTMRTSWCVPRDRSVRVAFLTCLTCRVWPAFAEPSGLHRPQSVWADTDAPCSLSAIQEAPHAVHCQPNVQAVLQGLLAAAFGAVPRSRMTTHARCGRSLNSLGGT